MVCENCIVCRTACQFERDRIVVLDAAARVTFFAPAANGLGNWVGRRVDALVRPEDVVYVWERAWCAVDQRTSTRWLARDVWDTCTWLTHAEPAGGNGNGDHCALATLRPVCHMVFALSARQREILHRMVRTCCTKKVAAELAIGETTIRSHLSRAQASTRCSDLAELLRWANDMQHALAVEDEIAAYLARRQG